METIEREKKKLRNAVDRYHDHIKKIEKERSEKIKLLFKECYDKLSKISYVSAIELDKIFEEDILVWKIKKDSNWIISWVFSLGGESTDVEQLRNLCWGNKRLRLEYYCWRKWLDGKIRWFEARS